MDTKEIRTLCLKHVYGAALTEAERGLVDDYVQTADGRDYLRECREVKDLLKNVADVQIKPVDHEAMVENFESTVRQNFNKTVFRPWWEANSPPIILGLMAGLFIVLDGLECHQYCASGNLCPVVDHGLCSSDTTLRKS